MTDSTPRPQINASRVIFGGGIAGAIFAVSSTAIFLTGIPAARYLLVPAAVLGAGVALVLHFARHKVTGESWILPATKK